MKTLDLNVLKCFKFIVQLLSASIFRLDWGVNYEKENLIYSDKFVDAFKGKNNRI